MQPEAKISPTLLSQILHGPGRRPTTQQADVTAAPTGPMLVVAGAGAGKTETMASRVVWLVANGYATPDQILGLTFTRKAAQELGRRIRTQFHTLAASPKVRDLDPSGELADMLVTEPPTVSTYDSYAGQLIREYGLLVPVEPDSRIITQAELFAIAHQVVSDYTGSLSAESGVVHVTETLLKLVTEMDNQLISAEEITKRSTALLTTLDELPKGERQRGDGLTAELKKWMDAQRLRLEYLPLVDRLKTELKRQGVVTFNEQMSVAARLARSTGIVAASQRRRFRVVMLDEYQDTSHAQRVLLSHLFGTPQVEGDGEDVESGRGEVDPSLTVTAVGDPMQAIYGWRGATVENLAEFVNDFPQTQGPADKRQLTTSWRNPGTVLTMANQIAEGVFFPDGVPSGPAAQEQRPVAELEPREGAGPGEVTLGHYASEEEEIAAVADLLAAHYDTAQRAGTPFTGAVLIRKNRQATSIAQALAERSIPYEILGVGGLLDVPEVADLVALATMLIRPGDSQAALRILGGPIVGLGLADLTALQDRARNLTGHRERTELPDDPTDRLRAQLEEVTSDPPETTAGLADAIADLGELERYSAEGVARLRDLSAKLRHLRTYSLSKSLPDLFADIESVFDVRTEVLAQPDSHTTGGAVHLDRFAQVVSEYQGDSLAGLLDYLLLTREHENGLEPGEVTVKSDRVQILTVHKAKGLEWDVVAVVHADENTYGAKASTYLTNAHLLPGSGAPERYEEIGDRKEFETEGKAFIASERAKVAEESARLFYVALTRTERVLSVTASEKDPYAPFAEIARAHPDAVVAWAAEELDDADTNTDADTADQKPEPEPEPETAHFPHLPAPDSVLSGAAAVTAAREELPAHTHGETFDFWEREVDALIEEHIALSAPVVDVELPGELTATDMVSIKSDPVQFAKRQRRPVPFKPNTYAKRGTAFHQWLEDRFDGQALLDEDQLPGIDEETVDAAQLEELKENFLASPWAERTPEHVEHPFEVAIGSTMVRGRMDAVFRQPDGSWLIVDWKTGQFPTGPARTAAEIQLAVYQEAWRRIAAAGNTDTGDESPEVSAAFYYVASNQTFSPDHLPDGEELARLLATSTTDVEG